MVFIQLVEDFSNLLHFILVDVLVNDDIFDNLHKIVIFFFHIQKLICFVFFFLL